MEWTMQQMNKETALTILEWRYEKPYDLYNNETTEESLDELLDGSYKAVFEKGRLVGFYCTGIAAQVPKGRGEGLYPEGFIDIGIGMAPDLTGQGHGHHFFGYVVSAIKNEHPKQCLRLTVAEFNERAIRLYKKFGFTKTGRFSTDAAVFITMTQ